MSFSSHDNKKIWAVGGDSSVPNTKDPVTTEQEEKIITALIAELQLNHALELDSHPVVNSDLGSRGKAGAASYLVVGSSNAKRLEEAQPKGSRPALSLPKFGGLQRRVSKIWPATSRQPWPKDPTLLWCFNYSTTTCSSPGSRTAASAQQDGQLMANTTWMASWSSPPRRVSSPF